MGIQACGYKHLIVNTHGGVHSYGEIPLRKNYAGIGHTYDKTRDAFYAPQPYPSWTLNETTCIWECPEPYPDDGEHYKWNEETLTWIELLPLSWDEE